jgi:hypothetical protein
MILGIVLISVVFFVPALVLIGIVILGIKVQEGIEEERKG